MLFCLPSLLTPTHPLHVSEAFLQEALPDFFFIYLKESAHKWGEGQEGTGEGERISNRLRTEQGTQFRALYHNFESMT